MACSRVVLVKLTKLVIASSVGSEAMLLLSSSALKLDTDRIMNKHERDTKSK